MWRGIPDRPRGACYIRSVIERTFRRRFSALLALPILLVVSFLAAGETASGKPPNIVLFYIDDLGWMDLGVQGSTFYETPRTDRLAEEGFRYAFGPDATARAGGGPCRGISRLQDLRH